MRFERFPGRGPATVGFAIFALLVAGQLNFLLLGKSRQQTFASAHEACHALFHAVQNNDEQAVLDILGAGKEIVRSDDEEQEKLERELFIQKYQEMHRLVREPDGTTVLYIGAENWPFPVPLISKNGAWSFDSKTGMKEVLFRRVGENEVTAIQVCHALILAAKQDKTNPQADDSVSQYAQGFISTEGGEASSPLPFHGYYFRILRSNAPAGANTDTSSGRMSGGFAVVAYPAEYRSSGVTTFIVNQDNVVYQKDLGPNTAKRAKAMTSYNPDSTWHAAE
jgi:hypothetical protein